MTATLSEAPIVVMRPIAELIEHPQNPREKRPEDVEEMRASIAQHGQMQPALVRRDGLVISGHRRKWASELLGLGSMPCIEIDCDDAKARALLLASNEHITPPDPFLEAEAVDELLHPKDGSPAWTQQQVSSALGRPVKWVARRAQLRNLVPALLKLIRAGELFAGWPVEWIEEVAILSRGAQEALAKRFTTGQPWQRPHVDDLVDLRTLLADELHVLGKAPFDIHDAELLPKAGACVVEDGGAGSCRKTTVSRPGLFDDAVDGDVKTARCCDSACWVKKVAAHVRTTVEKAKTDNGGKVLVIGPQASRGLDAGSQAVRDMDTVPGYQVTEVKGTAKGATPAVRVAADGTAEHIYVTRGSASSSSGSSAGRKKAKAKPEPKSDAERLKASREQIERRRMAHVIDRVGELVRDPKAPAPAFDVVLRFAAAYEVEAPYTRQYGADSHDHFHGDLKKASHYAKFADDQVQLGALLWARLRKSVSRSIERRGGEELVGEFALATWIAEQIGQDVEDLERQAREEVPTPKWWPLSADDQPKPRRATRGKAAAAGDKDVADGPPEKPTRAKGAKGAKRKSR